MFGVEMNEGNDKMYSFLILISQIQYLNPLQCRTQNAQKLKWQSFHTFTMQNDYACTHQPLTNTPTPKITYRNQWETIKI